MEDALVDVKQLTCKTGTRYLLNEMDWQVKKGEQWVVFGLNGSGKTTLLSTLAGYKNRTQGEIALFGKRLEADNILEMRQRIGWVSSSFFDNYYKNESVLEIILAGKTGMLGLDFSITEKDVQRAKGLLQKLHLEDKCNRPFYTLSKGERQNVLLARALLIQPELLILDEPCSGLDVLAREQIFTMVRYLTQQTAISIIYVTHYVEEVLDVFTHVLLLKNGKIFEQGSIESCFSSKTMSDFLGQEVVIKRNEDNQLQIQFSKTKEGMAR